MKNDMDTASGADRAYLWTALNVLFGGCISAAEVWFCAVGSGCAGSGVGSSAGAFAGAPVP